VIQGLLRSNGVFVIQSNRLFQLAAGLLGASGVVFGAWGAHGLGGQLGESSLNSWQTGVDYQVLHAILLFAIGIREESGETGLRSVFSGVFILLGTLMFSGSIYSMLLFSWGWMWPITPLGGLFLILGWILIVYDAIVS
tara:strand:+ start:2064 stop:2480 length:417 start_codon:yes stop_codon:yes gene_type:complete